MPRSLAVVPPFSPTDRLIPLTSLWLRQVTVQARLKLGESYEELAASPVRGGPVLGKDYR